jgi:hypothetical protein
VEGTRRGRGVAVERAALRRGKRRDESRRSEEVKEQATVASMLSSSILLISSLFVCIAVSQLTHHYLLPFPAIKTIQHVRPNNILPPSLSHRRSLMQQRTLSISMGEYEGTTSDGFDGVGVHDSLDRGGEEESRTAVLESVV